MPLLRSLRALVTCNYNDAAPTVLCHAAALQPGRATENSPAIHCWVASRWATSPPQGRQNPSVHVTGLSFVPAGTRVDPKTDVGIGSACLRRASSGVAPELSSHTIFDLARARNFGRRGFRRDAENHTPEARAPRYWPTFLRPSSEVGVDLPTWFPPLNRWAIFGRPSRDFLTRSPKLEWERQVRQR